MFFFPNENSDINQADKFSVKFSDVVSCKRKTRPVITLISSKAITFINRTIILFIYLLWWGKSQFFVLPMGAMLDRRCSLERNLFDQGQRSLPAFFQNVKIMRSLVLSWHRMVLRHFLGDLFKLRKSGLWHPQKKTKLVGLTHNGYLKNEA